MAGQVRNVVLVGHTGAGKTALVEALLAGTGAIPRAGSVADGTTVSDHEDVEKRLGRSVALSVTHTDVEHPAQPGTTVRLTLLDTPGHPDFVGELRAGLRAADAALFVVSAVDGVDGATRLAWDECAAVGMPRVVVVTHLDRPRADFDTVLEICQRVFGEGVQPLYLPLLADDDTPVALVGLLSWTVFDASSGELEARPADPEHIEYGQERRNGLVEGIIAESEDDDLLDRYLAGKRVPYDQLVTDLEAAVARGVVLPGDPRRADQRARGARAGRGPRARHPRPGRAPRPARHPARRAAARGRHRRPGRAAGRRGDQDDLRPLRGPDQPGARLLRHAAGQRRGARERAPRRPSGRAGRRTTGRRATTSTSARPASRSRRAAR